MPAPPLGPQPATRSSRLAISALGWTPTMRSISRPALSTKSVGILRTWNRSAVAGFSSMLSLAKRTRPAPGSPHVDQHRQWRALDLGREGRIADGHRLGFDWHPRLATAAHGPQATCDLVLRHAIGLATGGATNELGLSHGGLTPSILA